MSDSQVQPQQRQTVANANPEHVETVRNLISNHGTSFLTVSTFCASVVAFPILTFFLTLHDVYEGDISQARNAALKMVALVITLYAIGIIVNRKSKDKQEGKKDQ